jgi:uncharacterized membrane protein YeaQ/YmgE (transglycosylase-associated protein family)
VEATIALAVVIGIVIFGLLGGWVAGEKHRHEGEGFLLGFFLGPYGVLIEALLPTLAQGELAARATRIQEGIALEEKQRAEQREKEKRERPERIAQQIHQQAKQREEAAQKKAARVESLKRRWAGTPDWARMVLIGFAVGMALSVPLVTFTFLVGR